MSNRHIALSAEDLHFIDSDKPFMAAVSPLFFTHYGKEGEWAFDKNWIYRSDDMLYPSRWAEILALSDKRAPEIVQVISWNDYGESHNIAPVLGAEPGSQKWTAGMDHIAFREMTRYFTRRWRDGAPEVEDEIVVWLWYRIYPKHADASEDAVGKPDHANWVSLPASGRGVRSRSGLLDTRHRRSWPATPPVIIFSTPTLADPRPSTSSTPSSSSPKASRTPNL